VQLARGICRCEQSGVAVHDRLGSLDLRHQAVEGLPARMSTAALERELVLAD